MLNLVNRSAKRWLSDDAYASVVNIAAPLRLIGDVRLRRAGEYWQVTAADGTLNILTPKRASLYRAGLGRRLATLLGRYTLPGKVVLEAGDVVLDLGSNIGEFSLAVAGLASRVIAVEPDPVAAGCLRRNVQALPQVEVVERLLWKEEADLVFTLASDNADSTVFEVDSGKSRGKVTLRATTLDAVIQEKGVERIDLLKLDAEGAEPEVLAGAARTLRITRKVAIDCRPERLGEDTAEPVLALLREAGFTVEATDLMVFGWR